MVTCSATQYYVVRGVALAHLELHDNYLLFIIYYLLLLFSEYCGKNKEWKML